MTQPRPRYQPKPIQSWTVNSVKVNQKCKENGFTSPRVLYSANRNPLPVKHSVGGEWVIEECEEHTSWVNKVLKRHKFRPVNDLRKAVSESLILVNLVEILTNEKIPGIQPKPIIRAQKAENIRQCLNLLKKKRTDLEGVDAEDLAEGSLKAVLNLVSQIRKRFDKSTTNGSIHTTESYDQHTSTLSRPSSSKFMLAREDTISTHSFNSLNSFKKPDSIVTYRSNDSYEVKANQSCPVTMNIVSEPILPGSMTPRGHEESQPIVVQRIDKLMSTTQLDSRGVSQQGVETRREQITWEKSNRYSVRPEPRKKPLSAWSNANSFSKSNSPVREVLSVTVEERLKNLLDSPAPGGSINYQGYDDGELIQPAPPPARWNYGYVDDEDENNNMDDEKKINDMLDNPKKFKVQSDWDRYVSGYVPSHVEDKLEGPRAQALLDRPKISPREEKPTQRPDPLFKSPPVQHMGMNRNENNLPAYFSSNNQQERLNSTYPNYSQENKTQRPPWYNPHQNMTTHYQQQNSQHYHAENGHLQKHLPSYQEHISRQTPEISRKISPMKTQQWWKEYEGQYYHQERDSVDYNQETDQYKETAFDQFQDKKRKHPFLNQFPNHSEFDDSKMARLRQRRSSMQARISFYDDPSSRRGSSVMTSEEMPVPQYTSTPFDVADTRRSDINNRCDRLFTNTRNYYYDDSPEFDLNYEPSECSTRSHTPPLPQLSPGNTPPSSSGSSPVVGRSRRSLSISGLPESMQERILKLAYSGINDEQISMKNESNIFREESYQQKALEKMKRKKNSKPSSSSSSQQPSISQVITKTDENEQYEDQEDSASESVMDTRRNDPEQFKEITSTELEKEQMDAMPVNAESIRTQLLALETMYKEILQLIGAEKPIGKDSKKSFFGKRHFSKPSTPRGITKSKAGSRPSKQRDRDIKAVNKRFSRVESHVVTLARSVAHLSSELRTQSSVLREVESLRHEVNQLRDMHMMNVNELLSSPKFRPILPQCANPQRIKKLTKFFGEEPPLLAMFLKELGYQKYAANFEKEGIGMIELPYLSEERLESIGVPAGPRLRILQEAQLIV
ncbi:uncharacterized protein LOC117115981 isoform X2 [Anneissia japonica]|uniref:uncharacterized protein LOC117115981 isoform X2 n=1 Tax=Anneissia japonica TaxID=1529436 RepID=UPI0014257003|nr:uncharacterized protein LOC117115981 isoform X2 [Anneissia japonica]